MLNYQYNYNVLLLVHKVTMFLPIRKPKSVLIIVVMYPVPDLGRWMGGKAQNRK